ncbi:hypothetical protein RLIN73S_00351 [Rhodanobacter lindaniclasticus]
MAWRSSAIITAARSWAVTWLGATLNVQWASNLFKHLMRLPLDWFEKRHVGDVVSRFGSIQTIQRTLTTQFIGSLLDGVMSLVTLVVMAFYSVWLTALVVGLFAAAYGLLRWAFFNPLRRANEEQIIYRARQQSGLPQLIRGAMPIKLANKQDERLGRYANATVETANRSIGIQRLGIAFTLGNQLMFGIGRVAMIWIAAVLALDGKFSAGMLIAFIAYADQFTSRAAGLIHKWVDFSTLKLHAERVADIALTAPEKAADAAWTGPVPEASIELRHVRFRYADGEPWILRDCNLHIEAGESVAIVGPKLRQEHPGQDRAGPAATHRRRSPLRRHRHPQAGPGHLPPVDRRGDAGRPAVCRLHRRQHQLLRSRCHARAGRGRRATRGDTRRHRGHADGLPELGGGHGFQPVRWAEAAGDSGACAVPATEIIGVG